MNILCRAASVTALLSSALLGCSSESENPPGGTGGMGPGPGPGGAPQCVVPSQVVMIGDSYLNWVTHTFETDFEALAMADFRMYAKGGASMASGGLDGVPMIPAQLDMALAENPDIRFVLMDGGGNDFLIADANLPGASECKDLPNSPEVPVCQQIVQMGIDKAIESMNKLVTAGVKDVLYFFYPHLPGPSGLGGQYPNVMLDYALPRVQQTCAEASSRTGGALRCHFVDLVPAFEGHPEYFAEDGVHPNPAGSAVMAQVIWGAMQANCLGQPATSGCCTP